VPSYHLDTLGWFQFERLCQALLRADHGLSIEMWGGSSDLGRDAYAEGELEFPTKGSKRRGPFVFQAKFVQGANASGARPGPRVLAAVKAEMERIEGRINEGDWEAPAVYTLLTNSPLGTALRTNLRKELQAALPDAEIVLQGASDLDAWLDNTPGVRAAFPQLLGLRDLNELIRASSFRDVLTRSTLAVESATQLAQVFVPTSAYNWALTTLNEHHFVVLTGMPELGKTSIARMVALARLASGWEAFECRRPDDFFAMYDRERSQIFVADDAFGSTEYRPELAMAWAADLDKIIRATDHRHHVVWTSRPAPLKAALEQLYLQAEARAFPEPAQVQVRTEALDDIEKALILYRHAKVARLDKHAGELIRRHAEGIIQSDAFTPLRIQRFIEDQLPTILSAPKAAQAGLIRAAIAEGLREPTDAMRTSFNVLSAERKHLLMAMLDEGSSTVNLADLERGFARHCGGPPETAAAEVARSIDDHFIRLRSFDGGRDDD
jgi:hypothetical protein